MSTEFDKKFLRVFGQRIAVSRRRLGLTQHEFAQKIGLATASISSIETGRRWPRLVNICKIAEALDVEPQMLIRDIELEICTN